MDKFVEKAFSDAMDAKMNEYGWQAFQRIKPTIPIRFLKVCGQVGLPEASALVDLVTENKLDGTFTHLWRNMFMSGFIAGYIARKEDEENKK